MTFMPLELSKISADKQWKHALDGELLEWDNTIWRCEYLKDEEVTRNKLLTMELTRLFCSTPQPMVTLARDDDHGFYLLTEELSPHRQNPIDLIIKQLTFSLFSLMLEDSRSKYLTLKKYHETLRDEPTIQQEVHAIVLKMILMPQVLLYYIVKHCIPDINSKFAAQQLHTRQDNIVKYLIPAPTIKTKPLKSKFKTFLDNDCGDATALDLQTKLQTFKILGTSDLTINFSENCIHELLKTRLLEVQTMNQGSYETLFESSDDKHPAEPTLFRETMTERHNAPSPSLEELKLISHSTIKPSRRSPTSIALDGPYSSPVPVFLWRNLGLNNFFKVVRGSIPIVPVASDADALKNEQIEP